jgi:nucleotide-binding universal stress UspA family protein
MEAFKHILVPTDFGDASNRAIDLGLSLATKFECRITLLHSYVIPTSSYGYPDGILWPIDELSKAAKKALDTAVSQAKQRYAKVEGVLVSGDAWQQILETAKTAGVDLIVMGTHGRRGFSRVLLGSVAEKVVRLSPIPVLTVSSKDEQQAKAKVMGESAKSDAQ